MGNIDESFDPATHLCAEQRWFEDFRVGERYILPSRDLIVNDIEVQVEGALLDGMVCLASCDKTAPGQLMAAARLDLPTIIVPCGYQPDGVLDGRRVDIEEVYESVGKVATGEMTLEHLARMCDVAIGGPGVCAGMGTANTMHIASEALGMALPGSTPVLAGSGRMAGNAEASGRRIVEMVWEDLTPRRIMTARAFENAVMVGLALSGSINLVRHLQAVAVEARWYSRICGATSEEVQMKTSSSSRDRAAATRASLSGLAKLLRKQIATARAPLARISAIWRAIMWSR